MNIRHLNTYDEVLQSFDVFTQLRPHLINKKHFASQVMDQQKQGYEIMAIENDNEMLACIGFRFLTTLAWGKVLYIDDLITKKNARGKGYGQALLVAATKIGKERACDQIHLDTGYGRHAAHKVYLKQGFELSCHHLSLVLNQNESS